MANSSRDEVGLFPSPTEIAREEEVRRAASAKREAVLAQVPGEGKGRWSFVFVLMAGVLIGLLIAVVLVFWIRGDKSEGAMVPQAVPAHVVPVEPSQALPLVPPAKDVDAAVSKAMSPAGEVSGGKSVVEGDMPTLSQLHIQVGSYKKEAGALRRREQVVKMGTTAAVVKSGEYFVVFAGPYFSAEACEKWLNAFSKGGIETGRCR